MALGHHGAVGDGVVADGSCVDDARAPVQLQNMRLVIDSQYGPIVIPLIGHLILHSTSSSLLEAASSRVGSDTEIQELGTPSDTEEQELGMPSATEEQSTGTSDREKLGPGPANAKAASTWDPDYLTDMRGWLMTVAALFVGMAFQAGTQPPSWMPSLKDSLDVVFGFGHGKASDSVTWEHARNALGYLLMNVVSFAIALTLVVVLPLISNDTAARCMRQVTFLFVLLAVSVATNFACGISDDALVVNLLLCAMAAYGSLVALLISNLFRGLAPGGLGTLPSWKIRSRHESQDRMLPLTSGLDNRPLID
ncbi:unnamed protein product [Urochloa humidicola]